MKKIGLYVIVIIIALGAFSIQQYFSYVGPQLAQKEAIANDIERINIQKAELDLMHGLAETQVRRETLTNALIAFVIVGILIVAGATALFFYLRYDKRKESWHRQIDGSFALQDVYANGVKWKVDINKTPSGAIGVAPNGMLLQAPVDESFGPDRQLIYNNNIQKTRTTVAVTSSEGGISNSSTAKFLSGFYDRGQKMLGVSKTIDVEPEVEKEPVKMISLEEAIKMSNKTTWVVGQDETSGKLSTINIREAIHIGIVGASNTGKTSSTGLLVAFYARKSGYRVIVLDGKSLLDWTPYGEVFEVHKTNGEVFKSQIIEIGDIYVARKKMLEEKGIEDFYLNNSHGEKPVFIVLEEFGLICDSLRATNKKDYDIIIRALASMMRDSRAVGMHFCFIEQEISRWSPTIKALVKHWTVYKLEASAGQSIHFYGVDKLRDVGQFTSSTDKKAKFNAWHTKGIYDVKSNLKPITSKLLTVATQKHDFDNPLQVLKDRDIVVDTINKVEEDIIDSEVVEEPNDATPIAKTETISKRTYEDLTEDDKQYIKDMHKDGNSLKTITITIFGQWGGFYNKIVRQVLTEEQDM